VSVKKLQISASPTFCFPHNAAVFDPILLLSVWFLIFKKKINVGFSGVFRIWQGGHGERVEREPITGVWGRSPQRGAAAEPLVGGSGGLKLKHFLLLNVQ